MREIFEDTNPDGTTLKVFVGIRNDYWRDAVIEVTSRKGTYRYDLDRKGLITLREKLEGLENQDG